MMKDKMMDDTMMMKDSSMNGNLTAPSGDAPFGGKTVGTFSISVDGSDHVTVITHIKSTSSGMVQEGSSFTICLSLIIILEPTSTKGQFTTKPAKPVSSLPLDAAAVISPTPFSANPLRATNVTFMFSRSISNTCSHHMNQHQLRKNYLKVVDDYRSILQMGS